MSQARLAALRLLNRRDYTAAELREKLAANEHSADEIEAALAALTADRLIDDARVAAAHVRIAASIKGRGRLRIARELEARGISRALIADTLAALSPDDEIGAIRRFLVRKGAPARLPAAEHRRLFGQLLRRGYAADAIASVFRARRDDGD